MHHSSCNALLCRAWLAALLTAGFVFPAFASSTLQPELGQRWPNTTDASDAPGWHAYVFERSGVRYIQISDTSGTIHAVIEAANGVALALPMGSDQARTKVSYISSTKLGQATLSEGTQIVYRDDSTLITATPQGDNAWQFGIFEQSMCHDPEDCSGGFVR